MTQNTAALQKRRTFLALTAGGALAGWSCSQGTGDSLGSAKPGTKTYKMGERAPVGLLTYNVLESTYSPQIGPIGKVRMAQKRFLTIRLSITNGGAKEAEIPLFYLIDDQGNQIQELQDGEGVPGWFGLIRRIGPTGTEEGRILFDVAPKNYKLQVTDGGETGKEIFALVEVPMDFDTAEPIPTPGQK